MRTDASPVYVLDSFALLSWLQNGAGAQRVEAIFLEAQAARAEVWVSIINYGEALYITERDAGADAVPDAILMIDGLPIRVVEPDRRLTFAAAHIKATLPVSYADAFAIALAIEKGGRVVTGDPEFHEAESLVEVEWIPR